MTANDSGNVKCRALVPFVFFWLRDERTGCNYGRNNEGEGFEVIALCSPGLPLLPIVVPIKVTSIYQIHSLLWEQMDNGRTTDFEMGN